MKRVVVLFILITAFFSGTSHIAVAQSLDVIPGYNDFASTGIEIYDRFLSGPGNPPFGPVTGRSVVNTGCTGDEASDGAMQGLNCQTYQCLIMLVSVGAAWDMGFATPVECDGVAPSLVYIATCWCYYGHGGHVEAW